MGRAAAPAETRRRLVIDANPSASCGDVDVDAAAVTRDVLAVLAAFGLAD